MSDTLEEAPPAKLDVAVCRQLGRAPELRADQDPTSDSPGTLVGFFSLFDQWYEISSYWEGHFIERIAAGAFKRTINNRSGETPVRVLLEHGYDPTVGDKPLGVPDVLEERAEGGWHETPLFDTSYNRDLAPALAAGAYGQSFRFQVLRDEWVEEPEPSEHNPKGLPERTITEVRLIEIGPTVFPASPSTNDSTGLRSTTDAFYDSVRRRDPAAYETDLQSVRSARASAPVTAPAKATTPAAPATEDPQTGHSEDPAAQRSHSTDSQPAKHSEDPSSTTTDTQNRNIPVDETMTIEERNARISEIGARLNDINKEYSGAKLPDETQREWDGLLDERAEHQEAIASQEERLSQLADIEGNPNATESGADTTSARTAAASRTRSARRGTPAFRKSGAVSYDLASVRQEARTVDEIPALYKEHAKRAIDVATFPGAPNRERAQEHVERLLDTVDDKDGSLAQRVLTTGSPTYERAFGKALMAMNTNGLTAEEQRALSLGVNSEGGYAVPFQLDPTVMLTSDGVIDPIREIARVVQITGKEWQGITSAGITVSRKAEKAEATDDSPALGQPVVRTSRVDGFVPFTVELEQDWSQLKPEITMLLAEAKADEEADSFINGDGTANDGSGLEPGGVLATLPTSSKVDTATANSLHSGDLYKLLEALPPRFRKNATWLAELSFYNATRQLGADSDGGDLWVRLSDGNPRQLIGKPNMEASEMPAFSTANNSKVAVLGDFSKFIIVDRVGMNVELVPHLFGANRRPNGMRGIYVWWRNGSKVLVPNAFRYLNIKASA